ERRYQLRSASAVALRVDITIRGWCGFITLLGGTAAAWRLGRCRSPDSRPPEVRYVGLAFFPEPGGGAGLFPRARRGRGAPRAARRPPRRRAAGWSRGGRSFDHLLRDGEQPLP